MNNIFKNNPQKKDRPFLAKLLFPALGVIIFQTLILFGVVFQGQVSHLLTDNAYNSFIDRVNGRSKEIEYKIRNEWGKMDFHISGINKDYEDFLKSKDLESLEGKTELEIEFLQKISLHAEEILRANRVTGVYLVLCREGDSPIEGYRIIERNGLAITDQDPTMGRKSREDISIQISPYSVVEKMNYNLSKYWSPRFTIPPEAPYYFAPQKAVLKYPQAENTDLGCWLLDYTSHQTGYPAISYTLPLQLPGKEVYAILGVEITLSHLASLLPTNELLKNSTGIYALGSYNESSKSCDISVAKGHLSRDNIKIPKTVHLSTIPDYPALFETAFPNKKDILTCMSPLNIYAKKTAYADQNLCLLGLAEKNELLEFQSNIFQTIFVSSLISLFAGILGVILIAERISLPLNRLSRSVQKYLVEDTNILDRTHIKEVDNLIVSIENLSKRIHESQLNLSKLFRISGIPISAFEYSPMDEKLYFAEGFFDILKTPGIHRENITKLEDYQNLIAKLEQYIFLKEENETTLYRLPKEDGTVSYVRHYSSSTETQLFEVIVDVTREILEKQKIEKERDIDILTRLFNRRAFKTKVRALFAIPETLKKAAMVMMDVDKLKYVNDTFGHKHGDRLIREAAAILSSCSDEQSITARLSGDEFVILLYGYDNLYSLEEKIRSIRDKIRNKKIDFPFHKNFQLSISGGYAVYPDDSQNYHLLLQYADSAMYKVKKKRNGEFLRHKKFTDKD